MLAGELIEDYVKEDKQDAVRVIALDERSEGGEIYTWHVHRDEKLPDATIAITVPERGAPGD